MTETKAEPETKFQYESQADSGKYRLRVSSYQPKPGNQWTYTLGRVDRLRVSEIQEGKLSFQDDKWELLHEVKRNYGSFPYLWLEGHTNGHDYLICGHDYQGQTVIELDTGQRRDSMSEHADKGWGFCWSDYKCDATSKLLVVDGCIWACPWEYRFFDFSNPMEGWPELTPFKKNETGGLETMYIPQDNLWPKIEGDTITVYESRGKTKEDNDSTDPAKRVILAQVTLQRVDNKLIFQSEWVSEEEQEKRRRNREAQAAEEKWREDFRDNDLLYQLIKPYAMKHGSIGIGWIYDGWCDGYTANNGRERRICVDFHRGAAQTIIIEWAADSGPIKLRHFQGGLLKEDRFWMIHNIESMAEAIKYAIELRGDDPEVEESKDVRRSEDGQGREPETGSGSEDSAQETK